MRINVTQEHIGKGKRSHSETCPIALALAEQTGREWSVGRTYASTRVGESWRDSDLPAEAEEFIDNFDLDREVGPFEFELAVEPILELACARD